MTRALLEHHTRAEGLLTVYSESPLRNQERKDKYTSRVRMDSTKTCHRWGSLKSKGMNLCRTSKSWSGCLVSMMNQKMKLWTKALIKQRGQREPYRWHQISIRGRNRVYYRRITRLFGQVVLRNQTISRSREHLVIRLRNHMVSLKSLRSKVWLRRIKCTKIEPKLPHWGMMARKKLSLLNTRS